MLCDVMLLTSYYCYCSFFFPFTCNSTSNISSITNIIVIFPRTNFQWSVYFRCVFPGSASRLRLPRFLVCVEITDSPKPPACLPVGVRRTLSSWMSPRHFRIPKGWIIFSFGLLFLCDGFGGWLGCWLIALFNWSWLGLFAWQRCHHRGCHWLDYPAWHYLLQVLICVARHNHDGEAIAAIIQQRTCVLRLRPFVIPSWLWIRSKQD